MEKLKERIRTEGRVLPGNIIKVDGFLNHRVDTALMGELADEFAKYFDVKNITMVLTAEASGIALATVCAERYGVPMVFAKKAKSDNIEGGLYQSEIFSYTYKKKVTLIVAQEWIKPTDRVLIIDDFMANGYAMRGLIDIVNKAGAELARLGIPIATATLAAQFAIVIVVTYLTLIFGELVPKRIGMNAAERMAKIMARPMRLLAAAASPFVWLLSKSTAGVTRLLGLREAETKVTEAEIRSIIQEGAEDGEVQQVEQQIVGRVFSLGDRTVESIMTHRSEMVWLDAAMNAQQIREKVAAEPHNRYPVGDGTLDRLLGVVYLKDLFVHLPDEGFDLRALIEPAKFFHEGFEVYNALEQLRNEQLGYGIICDEFGVTRGIITLRDIFEALVGELPEQSEEPDIVPREDGSCLVDGQCPFYDFLLHFGAEEEHPTNAYNTVSGLILDQLKHIPTTGERLQWGGFGFEIVDMDGARIDKILITRIPEDPAQEV